MVCETATPSSNLQQTSGVRLHVEIIQEKASSTETKILSRVYCIRIVYGRCLHVVRRLVVAGQVSLSLHPAADERDSS